MTLFVLCKMLYIIWYSSFSKPSGPCYDKVIFSLKQSNWMWSSRVSGLSTNIAQVLTNQSDKLSVVTIMVAIHGQGTRERLGLCMPKLSFLYEQKNYLISQVRNHFLSSDRWRDFTVHWRYDWKIFQIKLFLKIHQKSAIIFPSILFSL